MRAHGNTLLAARGVQQVLMGNQAANAGAGFRRSATLDAN